MQEPSALATFWSQLSASIPDIRDRSLRLQTALASQPARVERITVLGERRLRLDLRAFGNLDGDILIAFQDAMRTVLDLDQVIVHLHFTADALERQNVACDLLPWYADACKRNGRGLQAAMMTALICHSESDHLILECPESIRDSFDETFVEEAESFFMDRAGLDVRIRFEIHEDEVQQKEDIKRWLDEIRDMQVRAYERMDTWSSEEEEETGPLRSADLAGADADKEKLYEIKHRQRKQHAKAKRSYRVKRSPDHIWGRSYADLEPQPIKSFTNETGLTKFKGCVTRWETRLISQGERSLCKFSMHERQGAINCTLFCSNEDAAAMTERFEGKETWVTAVGEVYFDGRFAHDLVCKVTGLEAAEGPEPRKDLALEKRVELHCHSKKSASDATSEVSTLIERAASFGHPAIAITDHGVVQAYPEAYDTMTALKKSGKAAESMKLIFGMEGYLVDDGPSAVFGVNPGELGPRYVALDLETTGLDPSEDRIIEVAAIRFERDDAGYYWPGERLQSLVKVDGPLDPKISELTGITDAMLAEEGRPVKEVLEALRDFLGDDPVVGHNIFFDLGFLRYEGFRTERPNLPRIKFNPTVIDTLALARLMLPDLRSYRLGNVCRQQGIVLEDAHRAAGDALATGQLFHKLWQAAEVRSLAELQTKLGHEDMAEYINVKRRPWHIIFLVKDELGLYNLYRLVTESHVRYFKGRPRIPRSLLRYLRDGLIVGAACEAGEVFRHVREVYETAEGDMATAEAMLEEPASKRIGRFYDYLEIQPLGNNAFMTRQEGTVVRTEEDLKNLNRLVLKLGEITDRPVAATCDAHFIDPDDAIYRKMLLTAMHFADAEQASDLYFRTTDEMLDAFAWLGEEAARRAVIEVPRALAGKIKPDIRPFPAGTFPPNIPSAAEDVERMTWERAYELYGYQGKLPDLVKERAERELRSIIDNGFSVMYYIAHELVKQTYLDGEVVGSRGSVGSSLVATLCGITEVNPLPPHHYCPSCHYSVFDDSDEYDSGYDLPPADCPKCGTAMIREGQDIPFETFLGFHGDKQPDIDLNFSGEYQARAHEFIISMFGEQHTFRAGTITSYKEKNAMGIVLKYLEEHGAFATDAEKMRLASGLIDVKRSTGQHPGGIVVVPKEWEIYDFTPLQFPADKQDSPMRTTHFDFHALDETILKLDILGHDDPTMQTLLSEMTGVKIEDIPIPDPKVMSLFVSNDALNMQYETGTDAATLGLPELGTHMARDMIKETRPTKFYDLVQLMGLSHGTDVWKGNAQDLIRAGTHTINDVIGCRDSIMLTLIRYGLPSIDSFTIMEKVRKGRGLTEEQEAMMREHDVPEWYIDSCKKIKYMFPKAHAAAYIISSLRIAWFKVYYPAYYYAAYFSVRADEFDMSLMCRPPEEIRKERERLGREFMRATDREQKIYYILELVEEMYARGIHFAPTDVLLSDARRFTVVDDRTIRPALNTVPSVSTAMGRQIVEGRAKNGGHFLSQDELRTECGIGPSVIESLREHGCMGDLPETSQVSLFEWSEMGTSES